MRCPPEGSPNWENIGLEAVTFLEFAAEPGKYAKELHGFTWL